MCMCLPLTIKETEVSVWEFIYSYISNQFNDERAKYTLIGNYLLNHPSNEGCSLNTSTQNKSTEAHRQ